MSPVKEVEGRELARTPLTEGKRQPNAREHK